MTWHVSIRLAAKADMAAAQDWYRRRGAELGDQFVAAIADVLIRLETALEQFPLYYRGFRRALTERFPYKIFFRIESDAVIVFRILHASQDHTRRLR